MPVEDIPSAAGRWTRVALAVLLAGAACTQSGPLQGTQKVLIGTWTSASGARLDVREDGTCDYDSATEKVKDGGLVVLSRGETGTLRCRTLFGGGASLQVNRWPVNDFRHRKPRTYMILGGVEYTRKAPPRP